MTETFKIEVYIEGEKLPKVFRNKLTQDWWATTVHFYIDEKESIFNIFDKKDIRQVTIIKEEK